MGKNFECFSSFVTCKRVDFYNLFSRGMDGNKIAFFKYYFYLLFCCIILLLPNSVRKFNTFNLIGCSSNIFLWLGLNLSKLQCLLTICFKPGRVLLNVHTRGIKFVPALLGSGVNNDFLSILDSFPNCPSRNRF